MVFIVRREFVYPVTIFIVTPCSLVKHKKKAMKQPYLFIIKESLMLLLEVKQRNTLSQPFSKHSTKPKDLKVWLVTRTIYAFCFLRHLNSHDKLNLKEIIACFPIKTHIPYGCYALFSLIWCFPGYLFFKVPFLHT